MDHTELGLLSIDDLLSELDRRFDHWVFAGLQIRVEETAKQTAEHATMRKWRGNSATCMGMAAQLQMVIYDRYMEQQKPGWPPD